RKGTNRPYLRLTDRVVEAHLTGEVHLGLYPMLIGDVCHWLVADFDGPSAMLDALAYLKAARAVGARGPCLDLLRRPGTGCDRSGARLRPAAGGDRAARADEPDRL